MTLNIKTTFRHVGESINGIAPKYILLGGLFLVLALIYLRSVGLYPVVFADEYVHSKYARLIPVSNSPIPEFLYLRVFSLTSYCGDSFLDCTRLLNSVFYALSAVPIFLVGRRFVTQKLAVFVSLISILGPASSYAAYFMPDSMYFFCFWLFVWSVVRVGPVPVARSWIFPGLMLGTISLVKPHALFLSASVLIYLLLLIREKDFGAWVRKTAIVFASFMMSVAFAKYIFGASIGGTAALTLFGRYYSSMVRPELSSVPQLLMFGEHLGYSFLGHVAAVAVLFAIPVGTLIYLVFGFRRASAEDVDHYALPYFTVGVFVVLMLVTSLLAASVVGSGPYETGTRLHMRYYNFAFPLFLIFVASYARPNLENTAVVARFVIGGLLVLTVLAAALLLPQKFTPTFVDSPLLRGISAVPGYYYFCCGLVLLCLILWIYRIHYGVRAYLLLFVPVLFAGSNLVIHQEVRKRLIPNEYDKAGIVVRNFLGAEDINGLVVVGADPAGIRRTAFHLDNRGVKMKLLDKDKMGAIFSMAKQARWMLVVGKGVEIPDAVAVLHNPEMTLFRTSQ